jgi:hypothetical protein
MNKFASNDNGRFDVSISPVIEKYTLNANGIGERTEKNGLTFVKLTFAHSDLMSGKSMVVNLRMNNTPHAQLAAILESMKADEKQRALIPNLFSRYVLSYNIVFTTPYKQICNIPYTTKVNGIEQTVEVGDYIIDSKGNPKLKSVVNDVKFSLPLSLFKITQSKTVNYFQEDGDGNLVELQAVVPDISDAKLLPEYQTTDKLINTVKPAIIAAARVFVDRMVANGSWEFVDVDSTTTAADEIVMPEADIVDESTPY